MKTPNSTFFCGPPLIATVENSFPSGHAAFFFALATAVFFWDKRWGAWLFAGALVNGIFRVVAGVHWPLDVVGGAVVGILSAMVMHRLLEAEKKMMEGSLQ